VPSITSTPSPARAGRWRSVTDGHGLIERASDVLGEHGISARAVEAFPANADAGLA